MLLERKTRRRHTDEGSWAVSYVDMLTLLLCFFIIFYNTNTSQVSIEEASPLQKIILDLGNKDAAKAALNGAEPGTGTGTESGTVAGAGSAANVVNPRITAAEVDFLNLIKANLDTEKADTKMKDASLEVNFEGISFFASGSTRLQPEASEAIRKLMDRLRPYREQIRITVQGHTDSRRVANNRTSFSDNWELSVLRATAVLKIFMQDGFSQENLSAEGFADTQGTRSVASADLATQRRITLRIEPRLK
jgi:chemotaxis protein MotB